MKSVADFMKSAADFAKPATLNSHFTISAKACRIHEIGTKLPISRIRQTACRFHEFGNFHNPARHIYIDRYNSGVCIYIYIIYISQSCENKLC